MRQATVRPLPMPVPRDAIADAIVKSWKMLDSLRAFVPQRRWSDHVDVQGGGRQVQARELIIGNM
ncbi:MAG TPA: hypothetical protein VMF64_17800 [Steroidobacteraceae bacterium]|nr:hypothetical protein [Steroidobacteraceae bacterium]